MDSNAFEGEFSMFRTQLALGTAAVVAATAGFVATTTQSASSAAPTKSYAWGLAVNGEGKQPYVESTDGSTQTDPDATIPANPALDGDIAVFEAGDNRAAIRVANLRIGSATDQLPQEVKDGVAQLTQACDEIVDPVADGVDPGLQQLRQNAPTELELPDGPAVKQFCQELLDGALPALAEVDTLDVSCEGDSGAVRLAGVSVLGAEVPLAGDVSPNTRLFAGEASPLAQAVQITFNRQTQRPNGAFDVDAVVVELGGGEGEIVLGHTTCGEPLPRQANAPAPAPAPEPVRKSVPVTG